MAERKSFTVEEASRIGEEIGIVWLSSPFDVEQFRTAWTSSWSMGSTTQPPT